MPWVIAEPGLNGPKSYKEGRTTYLCDWPDCANPAEEVLGCIAGSGSSWLSARSTQEDEGSLGPLRTRS